MADKPKILFISDNPLTLGSLKLKGLGYDVEQASLHGTQASGKWLPVEEVLKNIDEKRVPIAGIILHDEAPPADLSAIKESRKLYLEAAKKVERLEKTIPPADAPFDSIHFGTYDDHMESIRLAERTRDGILEKLLKEAPGIKGAELLRQLKSDKSAHKNTIIIADGIHPARRDEFAALQPDYVNVPQDDVTKDASHYLHQAMMQRGLAPEKGSAAVLKAGEKDASGHATDPRGGTAGLPGQGD